MPVRIPSTQLFRQERDDSFATQQDVYNVRATVREEVLSGRSFLASVLDASVGSNTEAKLSHLFIVSPVAQEMCATRPRGDMWL